MDYMPNDYILFVDESHMTIPQLHGMYHGDIRRKETLVDYGFRLPSALDNRPLSFEEFTEHVNQAMESGESMNSASIESWLEEEDPAAGTMDERARARLAELKTVERSLLNMTIDPEALTPQETARLDRIFRLPAKAAAKKLNGYLKNKYSARGEQVFRALSVYIQTHRTPEVTRVCMELKSLRPRPGPRTRKWLDETLPELLAGP